MNQRGGGGGVWCCVVDCNRWMMCLVGWLEVQGKRGGGGEVSGESCRDKEQVLRDKMDDITSCAASDV